MSNGAVTLKRQNFDNGQDLDLRRQLLLNCSSETITSPPTTAIRSALPFPALPVIIIHVLTL